MTNKEKIKKRRMEGKEMALAVKGLESKKEEKEWLEYQIEYYNLMLKTGLNMNHRKNVRDFKQKKSEFEGELEMTKNVINILGDQIRNGIECANEEKNDEETKSDEKKKIKLEDKE